MQLYKVYNNTNSREENLRRLGIYIQDNTHEINKIRENNRIGENSDEARTNPSEVDGETCENFHEELRIPCYSGPPGPGYAGRCGDHCADSPTVIY